VREAALHLHMLCPLGAAVLGAARPAMFILIRRARITGVAIHGHTGAA
jgi:hypothetical protein